MKYLHIGVNFASKPPDVPPVFVWKCGDSDIIVHYDKGGYGGTCCVVGLCEALSFAHTADNNGPQAPQQIMNTFSSLRERFPNAQVLIGVAELLDGKALPVDVGCRWELIDPSETSRRATSAGIPQGLQLAPA